MSLQYLKKEVRDEVDFYHVDKHQGFLQVAFNTLGIKIPHKMILSLLMGMIKHSQSTESNKFAISLQCLKKEVGDGVLFLYAGKHQSFHNLVLLFLMKVARYVQHAQTGKLVIFLLYLMKKKKKSFRTAFVFYKEAKRSYILQKSNHVHCYLFYSFEY